MKTETELNQMLTKAKELQGMGFISAHDFINFLEWVLEV
jgi:hypothetical protein